MTSFMTNKLIGQQERSIQQVVTKSRSIQQVVTKSRMDKCSADFDQVYNGQGEQQAG